MNGEFSIDTIIQKLNETTVGRVRMENAKVDLSISPEMWDQLMELCQSKAEEFSLLGYDKIKAEEIWEYFLVRYAKGFPQLHRIVNEILSLKVTQYMNWVTINAYKGI